MSDRPELSRELKSKEFLEYYYLKEELVRFCRENGLPTSGGKVELTERIAFFLIQVEFNLQRRCELKSIKYR